MSTGEPVWPPMDGASWQDRVAYASALREAFGPIPRSAAIDDQAQRWLEAADGTAYVGSRHHTVPRFVLQRWADRRNRVQVFHRAEDRFGVENVANLAIKDFYTVIDKTGSKNSVMESLLGVVEASTQPIIARLLNPFAKNLALRQDEILQIAQFASFQSIRTPRYRRVIELQAEWYAKTMMHGRIPDATLDDLTITPHQNETIALSSQSAENLMPFFACRPLAVIHLDRPLLYTCDEPIVLNAPVDAFHLDDCFLSDEEIEARIRRAQRKIKKKKRGRAKVPGRTIHFSSTAPSGHGTADEILLAISPRTALLWGPLQDSPHPGPEQHDFISGADAANFADLANADMSAQALDWVVTRVADEAFSERTFEPVGPLMKVCDGTNPAARVINTTPARLRPHRL